MILDVVSDSASGNRPVYNDDSIRNGGGGGGGGGNNGNTNNNNAPPSGPPSSYSDSYSDNAPGSFQIFKIVLFSLLIVSPCLRALYLWWLGGGRVRFRHSEDEGNPVVGLQYIHPTEDNWLGISYEPSDVDRIHDQLTQQQVLDLPEILYKKPYDDDDDDDDDEYIDNVNDNDHNDNDDTNSGGNNSTENVEGDDSSNASIEAVPKESDAFNNDDSTISISTSTSSNITAITSNSMGMQSMEGEPIVDGSLSPMSSERETFTLTLPPLPTSPERVTSISTNITNTAPTSTPKEEMPDEEQPPEAPLSFRTQRRLRSFTTTTCSTCSICIDEFVEGEKIRLLPLCGHAFHTECILPWLTERQGCCPLCKMGVLENAVNNSNNSAMA